jgi:hypothetical protein
MLMSLEWNALNEKFVRNIVLELEATSFQNQHSRLVSKSVNVGSSLNESKQYFVAPLRP